MSRDMIHRHVRRTRSLFSPSARNLRSNLDSFIIVPREIRARVSCVCGEGRKNSDGASLETRLRISDCSI